MATLPSPPAAPNPGAPLIDQRVEAAAFALLREGKNPTVALVRERMGGASPNVVAPALRRWRVTFAAHLQANAWAAVDALPAGVLEIVQALWSRALFEAHRVRAEARSTSDALEQLNAGIEALRERLAALQLREAELDLERRELARERRRLAELGAQATRQASRRRATPARKGSAQRRPPARRRSPKRRR